MQPKFESLDQMLDQMEALKAFRKSEILSKGLPFTIADSATTFIGLPAFENSYLFLKSDPIFVPGEILYQGNDLYQVLATDQTKAVHNVVSLLRVEQILGFTEHQTGTDPETNQPILELQLSHRFTYGHFNTNEILFREQTAPQLGTVLRYNDVYYLTTSAASKDNITTVKIQKYEADKC